MRETCGRRQLLIELLVIITYLTTVLLVVGPWHEAVQHRALLSTLSRMDTSRCGVVRGIWMTSCLPTLAASALLLVAVVVYKLVGAGKSVELAIVRASGAKILSWACVYGILGSMMAVLLIPPEALQIVELVWMRALSEGEALCLAGHVGIGVVALGAVPAVMEEACYRGVIQLCILRSVPSLVAAVVSVGLFSVAHMPSNNVRPAIIVGVAAAWLTLLSRSIIPSAALHVGWNSAVILTQLCGMAQVVE